MAKTRKIMKSSLSASGRISAIRHNLIPKWRTLYHDTAVKCLERELTSWRGKKCIFYSLQNHSFITWSLDFLGLKEICTSFVSQESRTFYRQSPSFIGVRRTLVLGALLDLKPVPYSIKRNTAHCLPRARSGKQNDEIYLVKISKWPTSNKIGMGSVDDDIEIEF